MIYCDENKFHELLLKDSIFLTEDLTNTYVKVINILPIKL